MPSGSYSSGWTAVPPGAMVASRPRMKPGAISAPMTLVRPESVLISMAPGYHCRAVQMHEDWLPTGVMLLCKGHLAAGVMSI